MSKQERRFTGGVPTSSLDWEAHKDHIQDLYLLQKLSLADVAKAMKNEYGFKATERMYKLRITLWKFNKRLKANERDEVIKEWKRRRLKGEESPVVHVHGRQVDQRKIDRYLRDHARACAAPPSLQQRILVPAACGTFPSSEIHARRHDGSCRVISSPPRPADIGPETSHNSHSPKHNDENPSYGSLRPICGAQRMESKTNAVFTHSDQSAATLFHGRAIDSWKALDNDHTNFLSDAASLTDSIVCDYSVPVATSPGDDASLPQTSVLPNDNARPPPLNGQSDLEETDLESDPSGNLGRIRAHATLPSSGNLESGDPEKWIARCTLAAAPSIKCKPEARQTLLQSAATHFRVLVASQNSGLLTAFVVLGAVLEAQGIDSEITEVVQHAVHACETLLGADNIITITVRSMTSILAKERENYWISPCKLHDICDRFRLEHGDQHPYYLTSLYNLAKLLDLEGYLSESIPMLRALNDVCPKVFGCGHVQMIMVQMTLSRLLLDADEFEEVEKLVAIVVSGAQSSERCRPGHGDPYALECLRRQALLFERIGKDSQIEPILRRVLRGRIQSLGILHRYTQGSKDDLESWLEIRGLHERIPKLREEIAKWAEETTQSQQA